MINLYFTLIKEQPSRRAMQEAQHRAGRRLLCDVLGITEDALHYYDNGKPYLPGGPFFNISHSGRLVLLAVSEDGEIGCDAEEISRHVRNEEAVRKRIAKPGEEDIPLIELWVRFEAQRKAGGPGWMYAPFVTEGYAAAVCSRTKHDCAIAIQQKIF